MYKTEEGVDQLRTDVFMELSKGAALVADYREDLLHLVKRLDTLADHTKDAARCLEMLWGAEIPQELCDKTVYMTGKLVDTAQKLAKQYGKNLIRPNRSHQRSKKSR